VVSTRSKWVHRLLAIGYVGVLVMVPLFVVTYRTVAGGWSEFWSAITSSDAVTAFRLTFEIAAAAVAFNTVFGVGVALLVTRYRFWGRRLLGPLTDLSVSVSPIVVGLALVLVYGPLNGWLGKGLAGAGFQIVYSLPGMIMATAFVSMPLVMREIIPVLEEEGVDQEQAAKVLGASAFQRFRRITLPIIRPALAYGIVLSLARCIGEFGAVKVVSGNVTGSGQTATVPLLIDQRSEQFQAGTYQLSFVLIVITVLAISGASIRRKKEHSS
jgi:sulfate/thiosulfate transport system permease protein